MTILTIYPEELKPGDTVLSVERGCAYGFPGCDCAGMLVRVERKTGA